MSLMYGVKRVQLSELPCRIPSLRHPFVDVTFVDETVNTKQNIIRTP